MILQSLCLLPNGTLLQQARVFLNGFISNIIRDRRGLFFRRGYKGRTSLSSTMIDIDDDRLKVLLHCAIVFLNGFISNIIRDRRGLFFRRGYKGRTSLSSTMIDIVDDDEGVPSLLRVDGATELVDTSCGLFLKYSSYIGPNKSSNSAFDGV
ncbi:hypothetical protein Tco_0889775 [Tanacetum coccineum]